MKLKTNSLIIIISYLIFFVSFINGDFNDRLSNYLMYLLFILNILLIIINNYKIKKDFNTLILSILILLIIIFSILSISGLGSYLNLFNLLFLIYVSKNIQLKKESYDIIFNLSLLLLLLLFYKSINVWNNYVLNRNDINPNVLAQSLFLCFSVVSTSINSKKTTNKKILIILNVLTIISIYLCNCRTALISILIYTISINSKKIMKSINRHYEKILMLLLIIGFTIPLIYVYMYDNNIIFKIPFVTKSLYTGREVLWKNVLMALNDNKIGYLTGLGSHYLTKIGIINNLHTWYLGSIYLYGIPLTILCYIFLFKNFTNLKNTITKLSVIPIFIIGFFETSALWSNSQFLILMLLLLDNRKEESIYE